MEITRRTHAPVGGSDVQKRVSIGTFRHPKQFLVYSESSSTPARNLLILFLCTLASNV